MIRCIHYRGGYKYQLVATHAQPVRLEPMPAALALDHEFLAITRDGWLIVKEGYAWDGPSGPTVDTPDFMRGSLVHDALYQLMRDHFLDADIYKEQADSLLVHICKEDGMNALRRWYVYLGVRFGGRRSATDPNLNPVLTAP